MTTKRPSRAPERRSASGLKHRRRRVHDTPPLPKGKRDGVPQKGSLPHGEELGRPKDSGRQGA